jgi:hypothetical protein
LPSKFWQTLGDALTHLCLWDCKSIASESVNLVCCFVRLHQVALGVRVVSRCACYSWRLPPPRQLGGLWLRWSTQGDCAWLRRRLCEGDCAHPTGIAKSNSSGACHWATTLASGVLVCPEWPAAWEPCPRTIEVLVDTTRTSLVATKWTSW